MNPTSCQVILASKLSVMSTDYQEQLRLMGVSQALHHHGVMPPHIQAASRSFCSFNGRLLSLFFLCWVPVLTQVEGLFWCGYGLCSAVPWLVCELMCSEMCVLEQSPRKARGIWGFVHPRPCLVSDVEVGFQLVCIRMRPLGAENAKQSESLRRNVQGWFCFWCVFRLSIKGKEASGNFMLPLCVCVNIAEFYFHMQLKVVCDANLVY